LKTANELGFELKGLTYSPITGGEGNIEFLAYWRLPSSGTPLPELADDELNGMIRRTVEEAGSAFRRNPS